MQSSEKLTISIPPVVTAVPGKTAGEARVDVEDGPRQDHVVVDADQKRDGEHGVTDACAKIEIRS